VKILLTGGTGQVGWELRRTLAPLGEISTPRRESLDLANPDSIRSTVRAARPDVIVNPAAYTAVDKAESEPDLAHAANGEAVRILAECAKEVGAAVIHYSTDYVFDGSKSGAYVEDDPTAPPNVYGRTKLEGEQALRASGVPHLILRTSWIYGRRGHNFLRTMLRLMREKDQLRIVDDQIGSPTWSRMIAEATALILARGLPHLRDHPGVYHVTCAGRTSWFGFAEAIQNLAFSSGEKCAHLAPIPSSEYPTPARRPANSMLDNGKLARTFGLRMPDWQSALRLCLEDGEAP
jgi:dTDP-4-dehydrorhamnose reductase